MNSGYQQITGVTNTTKEDALSGYIIAPRSGDRLLPDKANPTTRIAAKIREMVISLPEALSDNAETGFPVKVTIPFSAFVGRDNKDAQFDPAKIESIGLAVTAGSWISFGCMVNLPVMVWA